MKKKKNGSKLNWKKIVRRRLSASVKKKYTTTAHTSTQLQWPVILWCIIFSFLFFFLSLTWATGALIRTFASVMRTSLRFIQFFFSLCFVHFRLEFSCHIRTRMIRLVISFSFNSKTKNTHFYVVLRFNQRKMLAGNKKAAVNGRRGKNENKKIKKNERNCRTPRQTNRSQWVSYDLHMSRRWTERNLFPFKIRIAGALCSHVCTLGQHNKHFIYCYDDCWLVCRRHRIYNLWVFVSIYRWRLLAGLTYSLRLCSVHAPHQYILCIYNLIGAKIARYMFCIYEWFFDLLATIEYIYVCVCSRAASKQARACATKLIGNPKNIADRDSTSLWGNAIRVPRHPEAHWISSLLYTIHILTVHFCGRHTIRLFILFAQLHYST